MITLFNRIIFIVVLMYAIPTISTGNKYDVTQNIACYEWQNNTAPLCILKIIKKKTKKSIKTFVFETSIPEYYFENSTTLIITGKNKELHCTINETTDTITTIEKTKKNDMIPTESATKDDCCIIS